MLEINCQNLLDLVYHLQHGAAYAKGDGICFETQYYVDAINIDSPEFEKPILEANTPFHSETWYKFSVSEK